MLPEVRPERINPGLDGLVVPIGRLRPDPGNVRAHDGRSIDAIAGSLARFGQQKPVVATPDGTVLAGNGTLEAARQLGWNRLAVVFHAPASAAEARAFAIADNRTGDLSEFDVEKLMAAVVDLAAQNVSLDGLGFDDDELGSLMRSGTVLRDGETDPDAATELEPCALSKLGDLWRCGRHRILCGDSTSLDQVARACGDAVPSMIFTDPPYGIGFGAGHAHSSEASPVRRGPKKGKILIKAHGVIAGDLLSDAELTEMLRAALVASHRSGAVYLCTKWNCMAAAVAAFEAAGLDLAACIVWDKGSIGIGHQHYRPQHEFILYSKGEWYAGLDQGDVWTIGRDAHASYRHPTQKPVALIERAILNSSSDKACVIDPFLGSGSTILACERTGRRGVGIEIDPRYVDVAVRRWQEFTGEKAINDRTGEAFAR